MKLKELPYIITGILVVVAVIFPAILILFAVVGVVLVSMFIGLVGYGIVLVMLGLFALFMLVLDKSYKELCGGE